MITTSRAADIDTLIAKLADEARGLVTRTRLLAAGISDRSIRVRIAHGRLRVVHPGVYTASRGRLDLPTRQLAALLATHSDAAISHLSAATEWRISRIPANGISIVTPGGHGPNLRGVTVVRTRTLAPSHVVVRAGMRRTSISRTLLDLGAQLTPWQLAHLMNEARFRRQLAIPALEQLAVQFATRRGTATFRRALALHLSGSAGTKSNAEDYVLQLILDAGIPEPLVNVTVRIGDGAYELDLNWADRKVNVEVDGSGHDQPSRKQDDAERDVIMREHGWTIVRIDPEFAAHRPDLVINEIRNALASRFRMAMA